MEVTSFSDNDIAKFLAQQLEATGDFKVDDSPEKFIRMIVDGEEQEAKTLTDSNNVPRKIATFGTVSPDAIIINPLAEGSDTKQSWWYATLNACLAGNIYKIMAYLVESSEKANVKPKKGEKELPINTAVVELVGTAAKDIDNKTLQELKSIIGKDLNSFLGIYYDKSTKTSKLKCIIMTEAQRKAHSSVRAKTWKALEHLLLAILGTTAENFEKDYSYKATIPTVPIFESYTHVHFKVLKQIAPHVKLIGREIKNLGSLESHIKYLKQYHERARWQVSSPVSDQPTTSVAPWQRGAGVPLTAVNNRPALAQRAVPLTVQQPVQAARPAIPLTVANRAVPTTVQPVIGSTLANNHQARWRQSLPAAGSVRPWSYAR